MTKDESAQFFKTFSIEQNASIIVSTTEDFLSQIKSDKTQIIESLQETAAPEEILFASENIPEEKYRELLNRNSFVLMLGTDYTNCPVMKYAEKLSRKSYKTPEEETQAFKLAGTALENRFWGDEEVLRFGKTGQVQCRLVSLKLLTDYVADWIFKNCK